ncbi:hypothetical protein GGI04_001066 [Coemansia thaxteri]|nr:hypothetical protein GGI04_001066 [Coemansia thaxteri]
MIDDTVDGSSVKVQRNVIDTALQEIKYNDEAAKELVKTISERNVHKITDNTSITFDASDGLFKTPLGIVKREGVEKAIELLGEIEKFIPSFTDMRSKEPDAVIIKELPVRGGTKRKSDGTQVVHDAPKKLPPSIPLAMIVSEIMSLNEQYFVIIPNKVKNARDIEGLLFSQKAVDEQRATCDALLDTLNLIDDLKEKKLKEEDKDKTNPEEGGDKPSTFSVEIETIEDKDTFKRISDLFESTKNKLHGRFNTSARVIRVYQVKLESQQSPFEESQEKLGNVNLLWHGTRTQNLLSIMSKGLLLPKLSPGQKAGAMFGTAAMTTVKIDNSYMFLASVAVGPISSLPPKGYDSYWAKAGISSVLNDEIIVFSAGQVRLDYLIEIERVIE